MRKVKKEFMGFSCVAVLVSFAAVMAGPSQGNPSGAEGAGPAPPASRMDNLIAAYYLNRDPDSGKVTTFLFPIAYLRQGQFHEASVRHDAVDKPQMLEPGMTFHVMDGGEPIGTFSVQQVGPVSLMCSEMIGGLGEFRGAKSDEELFLELARKALGVRYVEGEEHIYIRVETYCALRLHTPSAAKKRALDAKQMETLKQDLVELVGRLKIWRRAEYPAETEALIQQNLTLERLDLTDLDNDGVLEAFGKFVAQLEPDRPEQGQSGSIYYGLFGVTFARPEPRVFFQAHSTQSTESWGSGHDFVAAEDMDGDGVKEVMLTFGGWEYIRFQIYKLAEGELRMVFEGAEYGC
ncbi:MAG: hypothetical protein AMXMBFR4_32800 [Candidatus Hydrogenedentota bacterium]